MRRRDTGSAAQDGALLVTRIVTGAFLIHGVWDNITDPARMAEFVQFLTQFDFPYPALSAPLTVWMQLAIGIALIFGIMTRTAALLCVITFIVGLVTIHAGDDFRAMWPALALVLIGLQLMASGAGLISIDGLIAAFRRARQPA